MPTPLTWKRLPESVPATYAELFERYKPVVRTIVRRHVKFGISHPDAEAEVWAKLIRAQVIDRYVLNRLVFNPSAPPGDFGRYFCSAAHNHLKNVFRTLARRANREHAMGLARLDNELSARTRGKPTRPLTDRDEFEWD